MTLRVVITVLVAAAAALTTIGIFGAAPKARTLRRWAFERGSLRAQVMRLLADGTFERSFGSPKALAALVAGGALIGYFLIGATGIPVGAIVAPILLKRVVTLRNRRFTRQIDAGTAEFAQAMASALSAGRSVRGALLGVAEAIPPPLAQEVDRAAVDLALGGSLEDALCALRGRTGSQRIEAMAGAIELHRGSGGDLVALMRELSAAFRERDRALRDAYSASAQARYTAVLVALIPVAVLAALELAAPGAVTGALTLLPTALLLLTSALLIVGGSFLAFRVGAAQE